MVTVTWQAGESDLPARRAGRRPVQLALVMLLQIRAWRSPVVCGERVGPRPRVAGQRRGKVARKAGAARARAAAVSRGGGGADESESGVGAADPEAGDPPRSGRWSWRQAARGLRVGAAGPARE